MESAAPSLKPSTLWAVSSSAVMKITGTAAVRAVLLSRRQTSKPSMPGMVTSSRTRSGMARSILPSACAPLRVSIRSKPCSARKSDISRRFCGLSSTINNVAPRRSADNVIARSSDAILQHGNQALLLEAASQRIQSPAERAVTRTSLIELQRNLFDAHQFSHPGQLEQFLQRGTRGGYDMSLRVSGSVVCRRLRIGVAPDQIKGTLDRVEQIPGLKRFAQTGHEGPRIRFRTLEVRAAGGRGAKENIFQSARAENGGCPRHSTPSPPPQVPPAPESAARVAPH